MTRLRLGTRGSRLALWQASFVARALASLPGGPDVEVTVLRTKGDEDTDRPLGDLGATGVFVKEIEGALLRGEVDLAVHSLKDLETRMPAGLVLGAVTQRAAPGDALVAPRPATVATLPRGAVVATGSPRRRALLRALRPDLRFEGIRGNVPTRVEKVLGGAADATVLARAGLDRLELVAHVREALDPVAFPPSPGQGALALQCREGDGDLRSILAVLEDGPTRAATDAERAFLRTLGGGCHLAAGAFGRVDGGVLRLDGFVAGAESAEIHRGAASGTPAEADAVGVRLAEDLLGRASRALVREIAGGRG